MRQALVANKWHWDFSGHPAPVTRQVYILKDDVGRVEKAEGDAGARGGVLLSIGGRLASCYDHTRTTVETSPARPPFIPPEMLAST